jgi:hypothetical protein
MIKMEKTRLAFDSDATTESNGEEVKEPVEGPEPGDPKGDPHSYLDDKEQVDGVPLDEPNSEHLSAYKGTNIRIVEKYKEPYHYYAAEVDGDIVSAWRRTPSEATYEAQVFIEHRTGEMEMSKLHGDANEQEPGQEKGRLVSVIEHEGHSASVHATSEGHVVKGKGSAGYLRSEPISDRDHAEEYAKEMLSAHAKLNEREVLSKMTNLAEVGGESWDGVKPKEKKELWASLTGSAQHKLSACMNRVEGHVDNPGSYCKSLADEVGYKPE